LQQLSAIQKEIPVKLIAIVAIAALTLPAFAQAQGTQRQEKRENNQDSRITQGERSGQLTAEESKALRGGQDHIDRLESKANADGKVTAEERREITAAQKEQSQRIRRRKHDDNSSAAQGK
jgi:uncharacterized protein HemX